MRRILILLALLLSACGSKLDCPSDFKNQDCGQPYGLFCLSIDQYTSSGYKTCDDVQRCNLVLIGHSYPCNASGPEIPR